MPKKRRAAGFFGLRAVPGGAKRYNARLSREERAMAISIRYVQPEETTGVPAISFAPC